MRLFSTISIEIGSRCNRVCWFCPNGHNKRPDEFMTDELVNKFITELAAIEYSGRIELYIYNEPLRDRRLLDIIKQFRKSVPKGCLMIATNGDYVKTSQQFQDLFDAGLNQLQINVYSNIARWKELNTFIKSTDAEEGNIYAKTSPKNRLYSLEQKYDKKITPATPRVGRFELSNRSGNIPGIPKVISPLRKMCTRPFRYMQVNWKGEVILCCNDYHAEVVCGNAADTSLKDIWENSTVLRKYRTDLLQKDRKELRLCAPCSFKGGAYPHFLPKQWPELVQAISTVVEVRKTGGLNSLFNKEK